MENAIEHGIMKRNEGGIITIKLIHQEDYAIISVTDNGVGTDDMQPFLSSQGVGMRNVDLRLKRLYGKGLTFISKPGQGTTVSFEIRQS